MKESCSSRSTTGNHKGNPVVLSAVLILRPAVVTRILNLVETNAVRLKEASGLGRNAPLGLGRGHP
jgi:hypothetical protein